MFILTIICTLFVDMKKKYGDESRFYRFLLETCTKLVMFFGRIHVHATGLEKVPEGVKYMLVGNHISNFDPIISWYVLDKSHLIFISKVENFKWFMVGPLIHRNCFLGIDRSSPRQSVRTIMDAAKFIKDDKFSVGIYPEGTRNKTRETPLLPFHNGMFKVAQNAGCPIVVVTIKNSQDIIKRFPWRSTDVYFDVTEVIPASDVASSKSTAEIGDRVRNIMLKKLEEGFDE